jgi:hypothetical protein
MTRQERRKNERRMKLKNGPSKGLVNRSKSIEELGLVQKELEDLIIRMTKTFFIVLSTLNTNSQRMEPNEVMMVFVNHWDILNDDLSKSKRTEYLPVYMDYLERHLIIERGLNGWIMKVDESSFGN